MLVICGAGASYDSIPEYPPGAAGEVGSVALWRPPLATQLFENRQSFFDAIRRFGPCRPLIYDLRRLPDGTSLEEELDRLQVLADQGDVRLYRQLAAVRFYLRGVITESGRQWADLSAGVTNYVALVNRLEAWARRSRLNQILWVTFNYDLLLEQAIDDVVGFRLETVDDYVQAGHGHVVFKPHGSVNWVRQTESRSELAGNSAHQARLMIDRPRDFALSDISIDDGNFSRGDHGLFPALAIPVRQKSGYVFPQRHLDLLAALLPKVHRVLVVGWAANERNFLSLLSRTLSRDVRRLIVCGNAAHAADTQGRMNQAGVQANDRLSEGGFTDLLAESADLDWLFQT